MTVRNFLENFILVAIILVIIQMFLDELGRYQHWNIDVRNYLLIGGLIFDFIFSLEFTIRTIVSRKEKGIKRYWLYERGWVDFVSSYPLLLLDSGPSVYFLLSGNIHEGAAAIGVLNILKVVKAIRVTRILRLVRIIKIFGKIHNVESKMAQHHTASISTTAVFSIICTLLFFSIVTENPATREMELRNTRYSDTVDEIYILSKQSKISNKKLALEMFEPDEIILKVWYKDSDIVSKISDEEFENYYGNDDYLIIEKKDFVIYASLVDINRISSFDHLKSFFIIIFTVISFMIIYTRHFVQNISDMIHIIQKGFQKKDYNLQVKIKEEYEDHEIFELARFYNDAYLPAKLKRLQKGQDNKSSGLSMKDLMDFGQKK